MAEPDRSFYRDPLLASPLGWAAPAPSSVQQAAGAYSTAMTLAMLRGKSHDPKVKDAEREIGRLVGEILQQMGQPIVGTEANPEAALLSATFTYAMRRGSITPTADANISFAALQIRWRVGALYRAMGIPEPRTLFDLAGSEVRPGEGYLIPAPRKPHDFGALFAAPGTEEPTLRPRSDVEKIYGQKPTVLETRPEPDSIQGILDKILGEKPLRNELPAVEFLTPNFDHGFKKEMERKEREEEARRQQERKERKKIFLEPDDPDKKF